MFNEGYAAHEGEELIRQDLCVEALRLGRLIAASSLGRAARACAGRADGAAGRALPARVDAVGDWCCSKIRIAAAGTSA